MPDTKRPRKGSMQYWPRVRAKKATPRVRSWKFGEKYKGLLGFAGYKAGMTHVVYEEDRKSSPNKGRDVFVPVTVLECPPMKIYSVKLYTKTYHGFKAAEEFIVSKDKILKKTVTTPKEVKVEDIKKKLEELDLSKYADVRVLVYTNPSEIKLKKKPEVFELGIGGKLSDKMDFVIENLNKPIRVGDVFNEFDLADTLAVTKGKGYQGPVKRMGVKVRFHKSEKTKRGPGSVAGGWSAHAHTMYRVAHAGQTGYHNRIDYNKVIIKISNEVDKINPKGGFLEYGNVNSDYILVKGSVPGPRKRLVRLLKAKRPNKKLTHKFTPKYVSLESKQ